MMKHILMTLLFSIALLFTADCAGEAPPPSPRLVIAHGRVDENKRFNVPANTRIVTFAPIGSNLSMAAAAPQVLERLKRFYNQGNTLFKDGDKSRELTSNGKNFMNHIHEEVQKILKEKLEKKLFEPSNHLPGQRMNNMTLSFEPNDNEPLGEIDVRNGNAIEIRTDKTDLQMYADKYQGRTIFVFSCRPIDHIPEEPQRLIRSLSAEINEQKKEDIDREIQQVLDAQEKENIDREIQQFLAANRADIDPEMIIIFRLLQALEMK